MNPKAAEAWNFALAKLEIKLSGEFSSPWESPWVPREAPITWYRLR